MGLTLTSSQYWDRIDITWEAHIGWETRGFQGEARALARSFIMQERNKAAVSILNSTTHCTTSEWQRERAL